MKGRTVSAPQKRYHDMLCQHVGCIACFKEFGARNFHVSVHHCDGRTKPNAHWMVLPLCAGHHQDGTGQAGLIAVHPYKARFEERYGTQRELMTECALQLQQMGFKVPVTIQALFGLKEAA